jgi:hypothetical protein
MVEAGAAKASYFLPGAEAASKFFCSAALLLTMKKSFL